MVYAIYTTRNFDKETAKFSQRGNYPDLLALNRQAQGIRFNIDLIFQIRLKILKNIVPFSDQQQTKLVMIIAENLDQLRNDANELKKLSDQHVIFVIENMELRKVKLDSLINKGTWFLIGLLIVSIVIAVCIAWFLVFILLDLIMLLISVRLTTPLPTEIAIWSNTETPGGEYYSVNYVPT